MPGDVTHSTPPQGHIMLTRADVERIIDNVISERGLMTKDEFIQGLSLEIRNGGFTDPNSRKVELRLDDKVISTAYFDVVQASEYEG